MLLGGAAARARAHNVHQDAILRRSTVPAPAMVLDQAEEATALACRIAAYGSGDQIDNQLFHVDAPQTHAHVVRGA